MKKGRGRGEGEEKEPSRRETPRNWECNTCLRAQLRSLRFGAQTAPPGALELLGLQSWPSLIRTSFPTPSANPATRGLGLFRVAYMSCDSCWRVRSLPSVKACKVFGTAGCNKNGGPLSVLLRPLRGRTASAGARHPVVSRHDSPQFSGVTLLLLISFDPNHLRPKSSGRSIKAWKASLEASTCRRRQTLPPAIWCRTMESTRHPSVLPKRANI